MRQIWLRDVRDLNTVSRMPNANETQRENVDDVLRKRERRSTQRVLTDQRHLEKIGREVKGIKRTVRKHAKRHR
jgi:hypothetical protein